MIKFQFFYLQAGTVNDKTYSSIKFAMSNPFRLYLIKEYNWVGGRWLMEQYLS